MNKDEMKKLLNRLEKEINIIEEELGSFARKGNFPGGYQSRYPKHDGDAESNAMAFEEMGRRKAAEHELEDRLSNIKKAMKKINNGTYGSCDDCSGRIHARRLSAMPETHFCVTCASKRINII